MRFVIVHLLVQHFQVVLIYLLVTRQMKILLHMEELVFHIRTKTINLMIENHRRDSMVIQIHLGLK